MDNCPAHQCWSILVSALSAIQLLSVLRKHLVIGQFSFSLFFIGQVILCFSQVTMIWVVHLPGQTKTDLITGSDQTVPALQIAATAGSKIIFLLLNKKQISCNPLLELSR